MKKYYSELRNFWAMSIKSQQAFGKGTRKKKLEAFAIPLLIKTMKKKQIRILVKSTKWTDALHLKHTCQKISYRLKSTSYENNS